MGSERGTADYRGLRVLVIGLGRTGQAVARFLADRGATVRVTDRRSAEELSEVVPALDARIECALGTEDLDCLAGIELVVPSPGVARDVPLLQEATARRLPIVSEIELAARHLAVPVLAITGTNGKSTTTVLLGAMLQAAGGVPFVGGNLGTPLIMAVGGRWSAAVVEVSSFQLEWVDRFQPGIGVFLNLTEDHLDRYPDLDAYGRAKLRLFARQTPRDVAILNGADPWLRRESGRIPACKVWFGAGEGTAIRGDDTAIRRRVNGGEETYGLQNVHLAGAHNRENMMAAIAAARAFGIPPAAVRRALEGFRGLEHRLEWVREHRGVQFVNDSKGTNAGAVVKSLASYPGDVILLAGGVGKGGDYRVLREPVRRTVKRAILFGAARDVLAQALAGATTVEVVDSLATAVKRAAAVAEAGDTVLL